MARTGTALDSWQRMAGRNEVSHESAQARLPKTPRRHRRGVAHRRVAIEQYGGTAGLIEGSAMQVVNQIEGIVIVFVYDAIVSLIILKIIDIFIGRRVSDEVEREGLDLALHGETVH